LTLRSEPLTSDHTWLLAVSCLDFNNRKFTGLPAEGRTDRLLIEDFQDFGLGKDRIVWLQGRRADTQRIDFEFQEILGRARKDDVLFVYYTGHGYDLKGGLTLATWNAEVGSEGWQMVRAFTEIDKFFRGRAIVFLADCCASGKLVQFAQASKKVVAIVSSASNDEDVPEGWSFTTALAEVFRGRPDLDLDNNGVIDWDEATSHVEARLNADYGHPGAVFRPTGFDLSWPVGH
jgi:hypothetical protein